MTIFADLPDGECGSLPERGLWAECLRRAIFDFARYRVAPDPKKARLGEDARVWLFEYDLVCPGSMFWVCQCLDLLPEEVRQVAMTFTGTRIRKRRNEGVGVHTEGN